MSAEKQVMSSDIKATNLRTHVVIAYALLLAGLVSAGLLSIAGVIWAYVKRGDANGTIYESHFKNAISTFWIGCILTIVGFFLTFIYIGWFVVLFSVILCLYKYIKGLIRALENKAY